MRANADEYGLDPDRIAVGGASSGGHLASLTALTVSDAQLEGDVGDHVGVSSAVGAVVPYYPSIDLLLSGGRNALETQILPSPWTTALLGPDVDDDPELARSASPRHRVHADAPAHLILHGDRDTAVNHEQSRVLHEALSAIGAQSTYVLIAGAGHDSPEFFASAITATVTGFLAESSARKDDHCVAAAKRPAAKRGHAERSAALIKLEPGSVVAETWAMSGPAVWAGRVGRWP
jgi:acetyl esterase/lipase